MGTRNLEGTARCLDCGAECTHPTPGDPKSGPLIIRHARGCPQDTRGQSISAAGESIGGHPEAVKVYPDGERGHIVVTTDSHRAGQRDVVFCDLGPTLDLWSYQGAEMTPAIARELGAALTAWADKKDPPSFDLMVTLTGDILEWIPDVSDPSVDTVRFAIDGDEFKVKVNEGTWTHGLTDGVLIQRGHEIP